MALDLKWLLSADDKATPVFDQVKKAGTDAANGIGSVFDGLVSKFNLLPAAVAGLSAIAAGGAFADIIKSTVDWDLSIAKLSNTLGIGLEQASVFTVAMHSVGVDQDTATTAAMRLAKTMTSNQQVFRDLGVTVKDSNGNYRDSLSVMMDVNSKLSGMQGGFDRNTIAMQIYGRGWADIQPLLKVTSAAMDEARETAERLHLIVGPEGVAQAKQYKIAMNELELVGKSLKIQLGQELLPVVRDLAVNFGQAAVAGAGFFAKTLGDGMKGMKAMKIAAGNAFVDPLIAMKDMAANVIGGMSVKDAWSEFGQQRSAQSQMALYGIDKTLNPPTPNTDGAGAEKARREQVDATIKKMKEELSAYQANETAMTAVAKEQSGIRELQEKSGYDQGLITTQDYFTKVEQYALDAAQKRFQDAEDYLGKESALYDYILAKKGAESDEAIAESGRHQKAIEAVQVAELGYAKTYLDGEEKMRTALKTRTDEYMKFEQQTLQAAGEYVSAEKQKQDMDAKSLDFLRLKMEAEAGVRGAVKALADVEQKRAIDLVTAQNKEHDVATQYLSDVAKMQDALDTLNGKDQDLLKAGSDLRDGFLKESQLQDKLSVAWTQKNAIAISGLSQEIQLQAQLNSKLQDTLGFLEQQKVLAGQIVGFSNGVAIYANSGGAFNNGQNVPTYQSPSVVPAASTTTYPSSPFVSIAAPFNGWMPSFDVGTPYVSHDQIAKIHKGEKIITAADNAAGNYGNGITIAAGAFPITIQGNESPAATADEVARQVVTRINELNRRKRAA